MKKNYEIFTKEHWYDLRYDGRKKMFRNLPISKEAFKVAQNKAIRRRFYTIPYYSKSLLRRCYEAIVEWSKPENYNYQKVAMYGHTWLYLCSPVYGHSDYNKSRLIPIKGHEKECEFLIKVSERVANGGRA